LTKKSTTEHIRDAVSKFHEFEQKSKAGVPPKKSAHAVSEAADALEKASHNIAETETKVKLMSAKVYKKK